jgi:hypothetical protein
MNAQEQASIAEGSSPRAEPEKSGVRSRLAELGSVLEHGRTRIDRLDAALEKIAASALTVTEISRRVQAFRTNGRKQLDRLRTDALKRVDEAPRAFIRGAAGAARNGLRSLSNDLHAVAKRLDGAGTRRQGRDDAGGDPQEADRPDR